MKFLFPFALLLTLPAMAGDGYPEVHMSYHFIPFDRSCTDQTDFEIRPEEIEELAARVDEFRAAWSARGPALLQAVIAETGKPFLQCEMRATMTLCGYRSMSHPLLLNMRRFLHANGPVNTSLFREKVLPQEPLPIGRTLSFGRSNRTFLHRCIRVRLIHGMK